jgi:hypothetical protein
LGGEELSRARREPFGESGRVAARGDHDLVGRERGQRVCDRKQRIGVADAAFCVNTASFEPLEVGRDPFLRAAASCVIVRQPVPKPGVQRRRDHEHFGVLGTAWTDAWAVVVRYADFFDACRGAIGDSLNAAPLPRASSVRRDVLWQDYGYANGTRIVVGLLHTDEFEKASERRRRPRPAGTDGGPRRHELRRELAGL